MSGVQPQSQLSGSPTRASVNARLGSPIPARPPSPSLASREDANFTDGGSTTHPPPPLLAGSPSNYPVSGPGHSAISDALSNAETTQPPPAATQPPPPFPLNEIQQSSSNYGSFAPGSAMGGRSPPRPYEDFDVVRRHLVGPINDPSNVDGGSEANAQGQSDQGTDGKKQQDPVPAPSGINEDEFSSLQLQGGDITRDIYRRAEAETTMGRARTQRSQSWIAPRPKPQDESLDFASIHQPGGFRRHHLRRSAQSPHPSQRSAVPNQTLPVPQESGFLTRNFFEFLSLYGHFAGEEVQDEYETESVADSQQDQSRDLEGLRGAGRRGDERTPLLKRPSYRKRTDTKPKSGTAGTLFILLKSFVGTGVLFLPRAFLNGGMLFSFVTLLTVSTLSYWCFILLTTSRLRLKGSYAEMGEMMYGKSMRSLINTSLVVSQMGFASAYMVFVSENLRAFVLAITKCKTDINIQLMILMQLVIFLPLSLYRNLNNISYVVYIADIFIVLGLVYLYYYGISTLVEQGGVADIILFNQNTWTLFVGTAIFTFEGIGLLIPIQDGMKSPSELPGILGFVMIIITFIFISMGALAYGAYGSQTETVILLNMNQENKFVNGVQFVYSLAILLSTPMQIFPAITIMENAIFTRSGKYSRDVKWRKNLFRFGVVMVSACVAWIGANDLDKFVSLVGSFACIPLVYIYPPLIHRACGLGSWLTRRLDLGLVGLGMALMVYTSALTIQSWLVGIKEPSVGYCDRL